MLFCLGTILFSRLGQLCSRAIMLFVIEDDCSFLGVDIGLSTRCEICFTLGLFATYCSLKSVSPLKSHTNMPLNYLICELQFYYLI